MRSFGRAERIGSVAALLGEGPRWDADAEEPASPWTEASRGAWRCRLYVTTAGGLFGLDVPYTGPPARPFGGGDIRP